jgi:hypothetical protein
VRRDPGETVEVVVRALTALLTVGVLVGCATSEPTAAERAVGERLLTADELGPDWVDDDLAPPLAVPSSLDPPCPFDLPPFDFTVEAIDAADLRSEPAELNVDHTVAVLSGDPTAAATVQRAWAEMDCTGSDVAAAPLADLPDGTIGIVLRSQVQELVQVVLVAVDGDEIGFLLVTAVDDDAVDVARRLAGRV